MLEHVNTNGTLRLIVTQIYRQIVKVNIYFMKYNDYN